MRIGFACWKSPPCLVDLFSLHQVNAFRLNSPPLSSANGVAIGASPPGEWLSPSRGSLLLVSDIHIMGLPLSITNRIRCKGAPSSTRMLFSSRGFPEQGMGFFHRIPTFNKRIEFASIASPSPNENGFAPKGSTSPSEWDSHRDGHPLSPENHPLQTYGILVRRIIPSLANGFRF